MNGAQVMPKFPSSFFSMLLMAYAFCADLAPVQATPQSVTFMEQELYGVAKYNLYVSKSALRLDDLKQHISYIAAAPGWSVVLFNPAEKSIHTEPYNRWSVSGIHRMGLLYGVKIDLKD